MDYLQCQANSCTNGSRKHLRCSGFHRSQLTNSWRCPSHGGPGPPHRASTSSIIISQFALVSDPHLCHPQLSTPCPLYKEMQRPLRPSGKVVVSTASPTKPPLGNSLWSADRLDTTTSAEPPSTPTLWELQPQHRLQYQPPHLQPYNQSHCVPSLLFRTDQGCCCRSPRKKQLYLQIMHNDSAHSFGKDRCRPTGSPPNLPTELASQPYCNQPTD